MNNDLIYKDIVDLIMSSVSIELDASTITREVHLHELGVGLLLAVELFVKLSMKYNINLSDIDMDIQTPNPIG